MRNPFFYMLGQGLWLVVTILAIALALHWAVALLLPLLPVVVSLAVVAALGRLAWLWYQHRF